MLARRFEIVSVTSVEEMKRFSARTFALILLCYTLSDEEILCAFQVVHQNWPAARILAMRMPHRPDLPIAADRCFDSLDGPAALLQAVETLIHVPAGQGPETDGLSHSL